MLACFAPCSPLSATCLTSFVSATSVSSSEAVLAALRIPWSRTPRIGSRPVIRRAQDPAPKIAAPEISAPKWMQKIRGWATQGGRLWVSRCRLAAAGLCCRSRTLLAHKCCQTS